MLVAYNLPWETHAWRQKVIVEVETPQGVVTSSSVQEVRYSRAHYSVPNGPDHSFTLTGDAVVVDLGKAGLIFALLDTAQLAPVAFGGDEKRRYGLEYAVGQVVAKPIGSGAVVPAKAYPRFVTFADIRDPKTVKLVAPNDMAVSLGNSFSLSSIRVEITDAELTRDRLSSALPWLDTIGEGTLDGRRISTIAAENRLANDLSRLDFRAD
jgi:hypothetical protein